MIIQLHFCLNVKQEQQVGYKTVYGIMSTLLSNATSGCKSINCVSKLKDRILMKLAT